MQKSTHTNTSSNRLSSPQTVHTTKCSVSIGQLRYSSRPLHSLASPLHQPLARQDRALQQSSQSHILGPKHHHPTDRFLRMLITHTQTPSHSHDATLQSQDHSIHPMSQSGFSGDDAARLYATMRPHYSQQAIELVLTPIVQSYYNDPTAMSRPLRILDLGAGTGILTRGIAEYLYYHVSGMLSGSNPPISHIMSFVVPYFPDANLVTYVYG